MDYAARRASVADKQCISAHTEIRKATKETELSTLLLGDRASVKFNELRIEDLRLGLEALNASERHLEQLSKATGGRLFKPGSFSDLEKTYSEVAEELRNQYALYYSPLNKTRDGAFRRVRVEVTDPRHNVASRIGYFAPKSRF